MSKKSDMFYFNNLSECAKISLQASEFVLDFLKNYDESKADEKLDALHQIEHSGDKKKHEMLAALVREFITPIERDDLIELAQGIDNVTDAIEDIVIHYNITGHKQVRPDSIEFAELLVKCCETLTKIMEEFKNFKKSKKLPELIVELNGYEEQGDMIYIKAMKNLHTNSNDALDVIAWRDVFNYLERACDACEHVCDVVESVVIGNI